jgi:6-pyruvoyl-tetrahydropterin synthase related domain
VLRDADLHLAPDESPPGPDAAPGALPAPPGEVPDPAAEARREDQRRTLRLVVDLLVVGSCVAFVLWHMQPHLLLSDSTPAGGDMGAHVWGPAYLRDHLLPHGQVAGWTADWYAGFPAFQFYMVVPSLAIVLLNAGLHGWMALVPAAAGLALLGVLVAYRHDRRVRRLAIVGIVVAFSLVGLPYGMAFKLVSVSGVATLPIAAYLLGRLAGARFPTPAGMAAAGVFFLFYRGFTIYGGNIASTLAGEFAFSMSLSFALVYLGVVFKGLETGRYRATAAVLLALTGLCHLIPAFWALAATAVIVLIRFRWSSTPVGRVAAALGGAVATGALAAVVGLVGPEALRPVALVLAALAVVGLVVALWLASDSVRWLTPTLRVGGLLSLWWVGPFYLRRQFLNDMGWEKLPYRNADPPETIWQYLFPSRTPDVDLRWVFALALVGAGLSLALRLRVGIFLALMTLAMGVTFIVIPEGRLWNGRLLPFYYLTAMLLAALAVTEMSRTVMSLIRYDRREPVGVGAPAALATLAVVLVLVGVPAGQLPFSERLENGYAWPRFSPFKVTAEPASFVPSWARWNYSGYEGKDAYREYHDVVRTMEQVGQDEGCGRAFWEYEKELDRYGTPMALMLLPYWTDGCIGSMEGLYFEASATTPFHFLTQVELSTAPSAAQRDLPYGGFDINKGVDHLQMLGVRYYMATSENAISQARSHPDLTEIARSGPWVVFEVADSALVTPLEYEPAMVTGIDDSQLHWVEEPHDESGRFGGPAIRWFTDPARWDVPLATSGPDDWQRVRGSETPVRVPVDDVRVSNIDEGDESISFDVDQIGSPVLVKSSYFPNWSVSGAEGPYRVAPNLMVVVPTETHVELTYGRTGVEYLSYGLTLLGLAGLVLLIRHPRYGFSGRSARAAEVGGADRVEPADGEPPGDPRTEAAHPELLTDDGDAEPPPHAGDGDGDGADRAGTDRAGAEQAAGERQPPGP